MKNINGMGIGNKHINYWLSSRHRCPQQLFRDNKKNAETQLYGHGIILKKEYTTTSNFKTQITDYFIIYNFEKLTACTFPTCVKLLVPDDPFPSFSNPATNSIGSAGPNNTKSAQSLPVNLPSTKNSLPINS